MRAAAIMPADGPRVRAGRRENAIQRNGSAQRPATIAAGRCMRLHPAWFYPLLHTLTTVIPAKAGTHFAVASSTRNEGIAAKAKWIPAFAGMTKPGFSATGASVGMAQNLSDEFPRHTQTPPVMPAAFARTSRPCRLPARTSQTRSDQALISNIGTVTFGNNRWVNILSW
ncbi:hypothetical protein [Pseudomonas sp. CGJS7]|uniref:hypothetical protein n=1 Tax=Pseudomonas sp. CGJS7 TaxID=3109348 RepID=UPI003008BED3